MKRDCNAGHTSTGKKKKPTTTTTVRSIFLSIIPFNGAVVSVAEPPYFPHYFHLDAPFRLGDRVQIMTNGHVGQLLTIQSAPTSFASAFPYIEPK